LRRLDVEVETAIFRIVQECLTNVHRHSGSSTAEIRLDRNGGTITLQVSDDGKGMPLDHHGSGEAASPGVGIAGMQERIRQLKGQLSISSNAGHGTTVLATIPDTADASVLHAEAAATMNASKAV
jgi:signal transduction histidine kinase